jgi:hypothetical protein
MKETWGKMSQCKRERGKTDSMRERKKKDRICKEKQKQNKGTD